MSLKSASWELEKISWLHFINYRRLFNAYFMIKVTPSSEHCRQQFSIAYNLFSLFLFQVTWSRSRTLLSFMTFMNKWKEGKKGGWEGGRERMSESRVQTMYKMLLVCGRHFEIDNGGRLSQQCEQITIIN